MMIVCLMKYYSEGSGLFSFKVVFDLRLASITSNIGFNKMLSSIKGHLQSKLTSSPRPKIEIWQKHFFKYFMMVSNYQWYYCRIFNIFVTGHTILYININLTKVLKHCLFLNHMSTEELLKIYVFKFHFLVHCRMLFSLLLPVGKRFLPRISCEKMDVLKHCKQFNA